jgi:hypothetical protein
MILIEDRVIDARFGEVLLREVVEEDAPEGVLGVLLFMDWADLSEGEIAAVEDYYDLIYQNYSVDEISQLSKKFDFFSKF